MSDLKDKVLELVSDATVEEVREAYRALQDDIQERYRKERERQAAERDRVFRAFPTGHERDSCSRDYCVECGKLLTIYATDNDCRRSGPQQHVSDHEVLLGGSRCLPCHKQIVGVLVNFMLEWRSRQ